MAEAVRRRYPTSPPTKATCELALAAGAAGGGLAEIRALVRALLRATHQLVVPTVGGGDQTVGTVAEPTQGRGAVSRPSRIPAR
jgi:hypothetical protein